MHLVVAEVSNRLLRIILHTQRECHVKHHLGTGWQVGKTAFTRVFAVEIQRISLHEGTGEIQHVTKRECIPTGMLEYLFRLQLIQIATVLGEAHTIQRNRYIAGPFALGIKLNRNAHVQNPQDAFSNSVRAITFKARVSSAPSKMDNTRASVK